MFATPRMPSVPKSFRRSPFAFETAFIAVSTSRSRALPRLRRRLRQELERNLRRSNLNHVETFGQYHLYRKIVISRRQPRGIDVGVERAALDLPEDPLRSREHD